MQQQRFASLMGRARQWLPPEEFEPDLQVRRPAALKQTKPTAPASSPPLANLGDLLRFKSAPPRRATPR